MLVWVCELESLVKWNTNLITENCVNNFFSLLLKSRFLIIPLIPVNRRQSMQPWTSLHGSVDLLVFENKKAEFDSPLDIIVGIEQAGLPYLCDLLGFLFWRITWKHKASKSYTIGKNINDTWKKTFEQNINLKVTSETIKAFTVMLYSMLPKTCLKNERERRKS